jgi:hypothetical protein
MLYDFGSQHDDIELRSNSHASDREKILLKVWSISLSEPTALQPRIGQSGLTLILSAAVLV